MATFVKVFVKACNYLWIQHELAPKYIENSAMYDKWETEFFLEVKQKHTYAKIVLIKI